MIHLDPDIVERFQSAIPQSDNNAVAAALLVVAQQVAGVEHQAKELSDKLDKILQHVNATAATP